MKKVIIVKTSDWISIFDAENHECLDEGHSLSPQEILRLIGIEVETYFIPDDEEGEEWEKWYPTNVFPFELIEKIKKEKGELDV